MERKYPTIPYTHKFVFGETYNSGYQVKINTLNILLLEVLLQQNFKFSFVSQNKFDDIL